MYDILYLFLVDANKSFVENVDRLRKYRGFSETRLEFTNYEELLKMFYKDTIYNQEVTWLKRESHINKWAKNFASNRLKGNYISAKVLEPFIARYVIAINQIGIKTFYSCDGWHDESKHILQIGFMDRNSMVWHKILITNLKNDLYVPWEYHYPMATLKLPKDDSGKITVYNILNRQAEYVEKKQKQFLELKKHIISEVKGKPKNMLSDNELEAFLLKYVNWKLIHDVNL